MEQIIITALGTVIAALAALLVEWARADFKLTSLPRSLEDHAKACQFLEGWTKTYQQVISLPDGPGKDRSKLYAETLLQHAQERLVLSEARATVTAVGQDAASRIFVLTDLFRLRAPARAWIWVPQLAYYAAMALSFRVAFVEKRVSLPVWICLSAAVFMWLVCWGFERRLSRARTA